MKLKATLAILISLAAFAGCQTKITAEKYPEVVSPIQSVVTINGEDYIITTGYMVTSGGWSATARSPLYATEALSGLAIGVNTNGSVTLSLDRYNRDLSTNAVAMVDTIFKGATNLAAKIGAALATSGASVAPEAIYGFVRQFIANGGDPAKASVTITDGKLTCTDGSCTLSGSCADGLCGE